MSNTFQDILLTMFGMHGQTHRLTRTARIHNATGRTAMAETQK